MTMAMEVFETLFFILLTVMYLIELNGNRHLKKQNRKLKYQLNNYLRRIKKLEKK